jgi:hypothetical protein
MIKNFYLYICPFFCVKNNEIITNEEHSIVYNIKEQSDICIQKLKNNNISNKEFIKTNEKNEKKIVKYNCLIHKKVLKKSNNKFKKKRLQKKKEWSISKYKQKTNFCKILIKIHLQKKENKVEKNVYEKIQKTNILPSLKTCLQNKDIQEKQSFINTFYTPKNYYFLKPLKSSLYNPIYGNYFFKNSPLVNSFQNHPFLNISYNNALNISYNNALNISCNNALNISYNNALISYNNALNISCNNALNISYNNALISYNNALILYNNAFINTYLKVFYHKTKCFPPTVLSLQKKN